MTTLAQKVPILFLATVVEAFVITIAIPQHLPHNPFVQTLIRALAANFTLFTVWQIGIYPFFVSPLRHLPQPRGGYPILGHGLSVFKKPPANDFLNWIENVPNDGLIAFQGIFHEPKVMLTSTKALAEVLSQKPYDYEKPSRLRSFLRRILGDGLVIVEGDEHKFQRKHIMPVFSFRHIKDLYPMMWKKAVALTEGVEAQMHEHPELGRQEKGLSGVVEVNHWANKVTMDIIGVAALGTELNALKNSNDPLIQNYEELLEPTVEKLTYFALQIIFPPALVHMLPWKINERVSAITKNLNTICTGLVKEKREALKSDSEEHLDILSVLIQSNNFSDQQLVDQLLTFLAAGHETTSSAFTWATYLLATHPDIQSNLRTELRTAIPSATNPETDLATLLESLPLLNAVCNETIRLYPTVPITVRNAIRPTTILDQPIPAGTQVLLVPWAINRSRQHWGPDAGLFKPERWIDSATGRPNNTGGATSNYASLTFLHGPRSCIGRDFAKAEMRCLVAAFVGKFEMELVEGAGEAVPHGVITTKPRDGMELRLKVVES